MRVANDINNVIPMNKIVIDPSSESYISKSS
jgi:hypothetical protein